MASDLEFTGERFLPGIAGEIAHEHWHRYAFARRFARGRRVLDVACGEGYGSALVAHDAVAVTGVDIDAAAIAHARDSYAQRGNLRFEQGSAAALPIPDGAVDLVVSFETIEHLPRDDQARMIAEISRVCAPGAMVVLSAPNPVEYSEARDYRNPFHLHEPSRQELEALLAPAFPAQRWYRQRRYFGSALWCEDADGAGFEVMTGDAATVQDASPPDAMYYLVVAARAESDLPPPVPAVSFFTDAQEAELRRLDGRAAEVLRLDSLLRSRDASLDQQTAHIRHLEDLVAYRDRIVAERDHALEIAQARLVDALAQRDALGEERNAVAAEAGSKAQALEALNAECGRLERALAAQERIIAYRQSVRWWFSLPWLRVRLAWQRIRRR